MAKKEFEELKKNLEEIELFEDCISTRDSEEDVEAFQGYVKKCFKIVDSLAEQDNKKALKTKMTAEELQKETESFLNCFCNDTNEDKFIELMSRSHRTLQQSYTRFVLKWIKKEAEQEYFDGRNERSVMKCRKIMEAIDNEIFLPMI